uniref:L antigen family member 3 n=1 Tax=Moschus moschiferus TaxID=68415 RepID=A0A8C6DN17_MOSMO
HATAMQASGGGAGGAEGRDDQHSSRTPACQSGSGSAEGEDVHRAPEGRGGPGRGRAVIEAAVARPGGDTLRVPFQLPLEADMARRSLLPDAQRHQGLIRKEFAVNGSDLLVRWTAEDLAFIRLSMNPFLDQLSLVIQNIQSLGPPPRQSLS